MSVKLASALVSSHPLIVQTETPRSNYNTSMFGTQRVSTLRTRFQSLHVAEIPTGLVELQSHQFPLTRMVGPMFASSSSWESSCPFPSALHCFYNFLDSYLSYLHARLYHRHWLQCFLLMDLYKFRQWHTYSNFQVMSERLMGNCKPSRFMGIIFFSAIVCSSCVSSSSDFFLPVVRVWWSVLDVHVCDGTWNDCKA